ncbi:cytochrome P450 4C1-like [Thrips palmi]|uniref:Cytochrome P450 4C1-like n=1 Tax=Thrips palmi TaxID=161013 RepID=A0A6P8ZPZ2_THRPL|nr:cytochrome P450 4C1-like [Thrips palmi]
MAALLAVLLLVSGVLAAVYTLRSSVVRVVRVSLDLLRARRLTASLPGPSLFQDGLIPRGGGGAYASMTALCGAMAKQGSVFRVCVGPMTLVRLAAKSVVYSALEPLLGRGLATLHGAAWRRHRKAITPSLHLDILRDFVPAFHRHAVGLADALLRHDGCVLDVVPLCGHCANSAIMETVMSTDVPDGDEGLREFLGAIPKAQRAFMLRSGKPWLLIDRVFAFHKRFPEYARAKAALDGFTSRIIRAKKQALANKASRARRRMAFLDHLLQSEEGASLDDLEIAEEVKTLVSIGSSSSMETLSLIILTLAIRQDVQQKLWQPYSHNEFAVFPFGPPLFLNGPPCVVPQEVVDVLGEDVSRPLTPDDMPHLQYTECVVKEVLRYYSVVPLFGRRVREDVVLPSGTLVPRGCQLMFWLPHVHRSAELFERPDDFDPDRFLPETSRGRHPFAFVPFSAGPRNCVGQRYAIMFLKAAVAALAPRVRFEVPDDGPRCTQDVPLNLNLTTNVRGGVKVRVCRRGPSF